MPRLSPLAGFVFLAATLVLACSGSTSPTKIDSGDGGDSSSSSSTTPEGCPSTFGNGSLCGETCPTKDLSCVYDQAAPGGGNGYLCTEEKDDAGATVLRWECGA